MPVVEDLDDGELALLAILSDPSGLDQAEFLWEDHSHPDGVFRAWPYQWKWFRDINPLQIDQCARSVGKSLSIKVRACCFPFLFPGQEMVITAPELVHLNPIIGLVEHQIMNTRLLREMLPKGRNHGITHRPFEADFLNGARIIGRIPQRDGKGVKGCVVADTPVLTSEGFKRADELKVGDLLLTHQGTWKPIKYLDVDVNDCYEVRGQSSFPLVVSCDHRFFGMENRGSAKTKRRFEEPRFHDVEFLLEEQVYWASPTRFESLPTPATPIPESASFWWLVGRYLADGFLASQKGRVQPVTRGRVKWCVVPEKQAQITERLDELGCHWNSVVRPYSSANIVETSSMAWFAWLADHFGQHADGKRLPAFVLGMSEEYRSELLNGYLSGDGHVSKKRNRIELGTASRELACGLQLLAQSLGFTVNCSVVTPKVTHINGVDLKRPPLPSYRLQLLSTGHPVRVGDHLFSKIKSVIPVGKKTVYNPVIEGDHSYVTGSIVSHNIHPLWLELDEGQDFPDAGWTEVIETLKRGHEGAVWRAHGVTKGVRDYFYKFTQPDSGWRVHRLTAMHRPTWSDQERQEKIDMYGSRDHPDYRRNILGLHGDASNPLFVLHRLMQCVDQVQTSDYNNDIYQNYRLNAELLEDRGVPISELLQFPQSHKTKWKTFWAGMDVGYTNHPSEILIFGEEPHRGSDPLFRLLARIHMERISHQDQVAAIMHVIQWYNVQAFAMDKTGLGLPLYQDVQSRSPRIAEQIRGYGFAEKLLVDFDQTIEIDEYKGDLIKDSGMYRNVLEYSSDKLRDLVDTNRLRLPWDRDLIGEFQGQTYVVLRDTMNLYGKKSYSKGSFHALDAARMATLAYAQHAIEQFTKKDTFEPPDTFFFGE